MCERAAVEQDPQKLVRMIEQINRLLEERSNDYLSLAGTTEAFKPEYCIRWRLSKRREPWEVPPPRAVSR